MMEQIDAVVRFTKNGPRPTRITWRGREITLDSTGRSWQAEDGFHILAMLPDQRVVELRFDPREMAWYLKPPAEHG